ncbi:MAG: MutS-related protein [Breznakibacter sp.]
MERTGTIEPDRIEPKQWFLEQKRYNLHLAQQYKRRSKALSWFRLAFFMAAATMPALTTSFFTVPFFLVTILLLIPFLGLIHFTNRANKSADYHNQLAELNQMELEALDGNFHHFKEDGIEFADPNHHFSYDLDIFGRGSIFQLINRTTTPEGKQSLAALFNNPIYDAEKIKQRQEALNEFSQMPHFRQRFYALSKLNRQSIPVTQKLKEFNLINTSFINSRTKWLVKLFPILATATIGLAIPGILPSSAILLLFLSGLMIAGFHIKKINRLHATISNLSDLLNQYAELLKLTEQTNFETQELRNITNQLKGTQSKPASATIAALAKATQAFDLRLNFLLAAVLNGFLLWDIRQSIRVGKWVKENQQKAFEWFVALHKLEAFSSLAGYIFAHPEFCMPVCTNTTFNSKQMGHPMIDGTKRVCNDFELNHSEKIVILTGANMAGKSTFLRTIGINYLLACMGGPACAQSFEFNPIPLISNMRTSDSLLRQESYFFAELKRLQFIVHEIEGKGAHFFILDEILKGTNSIDKTKGSKALVKKLLKVGGKGLIATHDLELGELKEQYPGKIRNNCFEVTQQDGELLFDYKLHSGVTQSHNATYLLRKMGLMEEDE